jgi:hypothetical protein
MRIAVNDAQQRALAFLTSQAMRINPQVYNTVYQEIQYPNLVPVDAAGPEWVAGITYFSADAVGRASWFTGKADDVPLADVTRDKIETTIGMAAIGYDYSMDELGHAQMLGVDLRADKADAARRAAEEFIDRVAFLGDTTKGYTGLTNNASVTAGSAAATGTGSSTLWANKTPDNILADINAALTGMFTASLGAEMANTLLLPYARIQDISTRRIDTVNQTTILEWVERNNIYTRMTGQPLLTRGVFGLETAGSGSTSRMVAYKRDPAVVTMYMPMPFRFFPAMQVGPFRFMVPGAFRISGVDVRRPGAMRYVDGI